MQEWVVRVVEAMGVFGIAALMLLENVFPPLPSEVIMPLAGYLSATGKLSFWGAVAAGTAGSLAGTTFWYLLGRRISPEGLRHWVERHGIWVAMRPEDVERAGRFFRRHGGVSVLVGRLVPVVRTLISVPAGFSRMPLPTFLLYSAAGSALWSGLLAYAGRLLGAHFPQAGRWVGLVAWVVIGVSLVAYVVRVVRLRRGARAGRGPA